MRGIPTSTNSPDDETFEKKVEIFLRSTGRLFPLTDRQVEAFERLDIKEQASFIFSDPEAILKNGFMKVEHSTDNSSLSGLEEDFKRAAARNGGVIPPEVRRRMDEDRGRE